MVVLGIAWIVLTPYLTGLTVARVQPLNRLVARHLVVATAIGWTALATVVVAVIAIGGGGVTAALVAAPLVGFAFWMPGPGGDNPTEDEPPETPPEDPPPLWRVLRQPPRRRQGPPAPPRVRGGREPSRTAPRRS